MTCPQFDQQLAAYLAGELSEHDARALEAHASACDACEHRLEAATTVTAWSFAPPVPPGLRDDTLRAVRERRAQAVTSSRERRRWFGAFTGLAAAALLAIAVFSSRRTPVAAADTTLAVALPDGRDTAMQLMADVLSADSEARTEFAALDAAAAELRSAMEGAPNDPELRAFLAAVTDRRAELAQRVKDASL